MKCVVAKSVLQLLLSEQKEHCAAVANDLIQTTTNGPDFLKQVINGDEWWVYSYDLETKAQSSQWKSSASPCQEGIPKSQQDQDHVMGFFDWEGAVHHEYVPPSQTVNKELYLNVLHWLRDVIQQNSYGYGQLVIGSFIRTTHLLVHHVLCRVFWQNIKSPP